MGQGNHNTSKGKWKQLCEKKRYQIEALLKSRLTPTSIAAQLGRDRRTIEREIKRGVVEQREIVCTKNGRRIKGVGCSDW